MSQKIEFVIEASKKRANISALCRQFGISRETGHKWLKRYRKHGFDGLEEKSRRPKTTPLATAEDIVAAIISARDDHPRWGPRKLEALLKRQFEEETPSVRTIARVLKRFGKVKQRRRRGPLSVVDKAPTIVTEAPNDVWTIDLKGCWRLADGSRCGPLTVRDAFSRYVLAVVILEHATSDAVRAVLERLFRKHGVPKAIQCDNGSPFICVRSAGGLTTLSAWWISLGIKVVRSRAGHPEDNGGHERMHADIAADVESSPSVNLRAEQRACDRWRQEFNHVRPHEALGQRTPAEVYRSSPTRLTIRRPLYPSSWLARRVTKSGAIVVDDERYFLSKAVAGHCVGLEPIGAMKYRAWFYDVELRILELVTEVVDLVAERRARAR